MVHVEEKVDLRELCFYFAFKNNFQLLKTVFLTLRISPIYVLWNSPPLYIRRMHFELKGLRIVLYNFVQILKVHYVKKQCRTRSDDKCVWPVSALFASVQPKWTLCLFRYNDYNFIITEQNCRNSDLYVMVIAIEILENKISVWRFVFETIKI